jgi:hypothetical protein
LLVDKLADTENLAIGGAHLAVDQTGGIHVTWYQTALVVNWNLWSVWYGRSSDDGNSWQVTEMATPYFGDSDIAVDGENNVHLLYGRNIGQGDGRWHMWSRDGGQSWSDARPLYPGVEYASGITGGFDFALDGDNQLHLVNSYGNKDGEASAWHMVWMGDRWSEPELVLGIEYHAHSPRLAIAGGNELDVVAMAPRQDYAIVYLQKMTYGNSTDQRELATRPVETFVEEAITVDDRTILPPIEAPRELLSDEARVAPPTRAPFNAILIAMGAAALIILAAILLQRRLSDGRR